MRHLRLKTAVAGASAFAILAIHGPAQAVSPPAVGETPQRLIQVQDMETEAVHENLRPNLNPKSTDQQTPQDDSASKSKSRSIGGNDGDIEDETIDEIVPD